MSVSFLGSQVSASAALSSSRPPGPSTGASHAKGSYTALIASTAYPTAWVLVSIPRGGANDYLLDIAVGAVGVEQVVIPNLPYSCNSSSSNTGSTFLFPLHIPAGTRIAARGQNSSASNNTLPIQVTCLAPMLGGERGLGKVEDCGAVTASSVGTSVDPGGTANTKGAWAPLIAATTIPYRWVCVSIGHTNVLGANTSWTVDIGIGAASSEVVVVPDLAVYGGSVGDANPAVGLCFPLSIPAGTRIAARAQCSVNTASERLLEVVLHGAG